MSTRRTGTYVLATLTAAGVAALLSLAFPAPGGPIHEIAKSTIDTGGGTASGGTYEVHGTIGQPDAHVALAGTTYELSGGFWGFSQGPAPCPWDCQTVPDGETGVADFLALLAQWALVGTSCDFDGGGVGVTDFLDLLAGWGPCP